MADPKVPTDILVMADPKVPTDILVMADPKVPTDAPHRDLSDTALDSI